MSDKLKDILSNLQTGVDQETLLRYLQGQLTPEQQHEVEKQMMEDDFNADAWEGLTGMKDQASIQVAVEQLQRDLRRKTRLRKRTKQLADVPGWLIMSVVFILLLLVVAYFVIHRFLHP